MAHILVVDDIEDNILLLTFNLEDEGHQVSAATSGQTAYDLALTQHPDLILLDVMMPGWDGLQTLRQLKQNAATADIPVIMVSARHADASIIEALDIGAHDYVTKPYIYPVLAARLRSALRLRQAQQDLAQANLTLSQLASLDPLTETYNRRHFYTLTKSELARARRYNRPLSLFMLDIDHFKSINDNYGHAAGDQALINLTRLCKQTIRQSDILARFGGEEFVICCPDTDIGAAEQLAQRLRWLLHKEGLAIGGGQILPATASFGVAALSSVDASIEDLINRADTFLYRAKHAGRNRVVSQP